MLELRSIEIDDIEWVRPILLQSRQMGCEYNFANNFAWRRTFNERIGRIGDFYILACGNGEDLSFVFPSGSGDYISVLQEIKNYCKDLGVPLRINGVTDAAMPILRSAFGEKIIVAEDRNNFDYIYNTKDLAELSGKKYHAKRNHFNRFFSKYNAQILPICENDFDECIAFAARSYNENMSYDDESAIGEQFAIHTFFENFERLGMMGAVLRVDGELCAFTLASVINQNVCDINIEKADTSFDGSYTVICSSFASMICDKFDYINREEDLGIEGLRKSKLSYKPVFLLKKYSVTIE